MSWIRAKYEIPSLGLPLLLVGYVSYIQVVYTSLNLEKLGHFSIADEYL